MENKTVKKKRRRLKRTILRKLMAMLLSAILIVGVASHVAAEEGWDAVVGSEDITGNGWTLTADGILTIQSDAGMGDWKNNVEISRAKVRSIKMQDGVTGLDGIAFGTYVNLTQITIPKTVTSMSRSIYVYSSTLMEIVVSEENPMYSSKDGAVFSKDKTILYWFPPGKTDSYTIPTGVVSIGEYAFANSALSEVVIPASVQTIGSDAFSWSAKLARVIMQRATPPTLTSNMIFVDAPCVADGNKGIFVPSGSLSAYQTFGNWVGYQDHITDGTLSDADKVAAAKAAVGEIGSLGGVTLDNYATQERLQNELKAALTDTIPGIDITVSGFGITPATGDAQGRITATITITAGSVTEDVLVDRVIPALPKSDVDKVVQAKSAIKAVLPGESGSGTGIVVTNGTTADTLKGDIEAELVKKGIEGVGITVSGFDITLATGDASGAITATITITAGSVTETVSVDEKIPKLPGGTADEAVKAAEPIVKNLAGIIVTNDTTVESLKTAIETALMAAGISDMTVTTTSLVLNKATTSEAGSISGTINIVYGGETIPVTISKTIAKLPDDGTGGESGGGTGGGSGDGTGGESGSGSGGGPNGVNQAGAKVPVKDGDAASANGSGPKAGNIAPANGSGPKAGDTASANGSEPKTGDTASVEVYATLAMISGFAYLMLYVTDQKRGMKEETKRELVSQIIGWARRGGRLRLLAALAAIFLLLAYYHSIGRQVRVKWEGAYEQ